jgi:enhancing lycopene biosynthesis protein 2
VTVPSAKSRVDIVRELDVLNVLDGTTRTIERRVAIEAARVALKWVLVTPYQRPSTRIMRITK